MKYILPLFILFFSHTLIKAQNVNSILNNCFQAVSNQQQLSYQYNLEINYASENYTSSLEGECFINFDQKDNPIGFTFQFQDKAAKIIYNGAECFELDIPGKTIAINKHPNIKQLSRFTFQNNSPITLKNSLPQILTNESFKKTLDNDAAQKQYFTVHIDMGQNFLDNLGDIVPITVKREMTYTILIDKKSYLPIEIIQKNDIDKDDYVKTRFAYHADNREPKENSWYYSNYPEFKPKQEETLKKLALDQNVPDWELPNVESHEPIHSSSMAGSYTLLEFWIKNCGYCIAAVPELNKIQEQYKDKGLTIVGINAGDNESDLKNFISKNNPKYFNLWDKDNSVAKSFGVAGYPQVFLIDKQGKLLFQGSVNSEDLKDMLSKL